MRAGGNGRPRVDLETGEGLIIEREALLPRFRRAGQYGWGIACWVLLVDMLRPLLAVALWFGGADWARRTVFSREGLRNPDFFLYYSLVVLAIFLVSFGWNRYNYLRFRRADRRHPRGDAEPYEVARHYNISMEDLEALSAADVEISFPPGERILIETDSKRWISALYDPRGLREAIARGKPKDESARAVAGRRK